MSGYSFPGQRALWKHDFNCPNRTADAGCRNWLAVQYYWLDAWQRSILFLDVLRQRGHVSREHNTRAPPRTIPDVILGGRTLKRPVNYGLVRIVPPAGTVIDRPVPRWRRRATLHRSSVAACGP
jgi:hypothetical protein